MTTYDFRTVKTPKLRRPYESLTDRGKAVRVAQDVLSQLALKRFRVQKGSYYARSEAENTCYVCALGAVFASSSSITGKLPTYYPGYSDMIDQIKNLFPNYVLLEALFEGWGKDDQPKLTNREGEAVDKFRTAVPSPEDRLVLLMKNVINNRGTLKLKGLV